MRKMCRLNDPSSRPADGHLPVPTANGHDDSGIDDGISYGNGNSTINDGSDYGSRVAMEWTVTAALRHSRFTKVEFLRTRLQLNDIKSYTDGRVALSLRQAHG